MTPGHVVLDTKYKKEKLSTPDFHQIHSYARMMSCSEGILVYPEPLDSATDVNVEDVQIRTMAFRLDRDLEAAGRTLLAGLPLSRAAHVLG